MQSSRDHNKRYIQIGTVGIRNPENRNEILESIPIYAEETPELKEQEAAMFSDMAFCRLLADRFQQYQKAMRGRGGPGCT